MKTNFNEIITRVNNQMGRQVLLLFEGTGTLVAFVRPLSRMRSHMLLHRRFVRKCFVTMLAFQRFIS